MMEPLAKVPGAVGNPFRGSPTANLRVLRGDRPSVKSSPAEDAEVRRDVPRHSPIVSSRHAEFCKKLEGIDNAVRCEEVAVVVCAY